MCKVCLGFIKAFNYGLLGFIVGFMCSFFFPSLGMSITAISCLLMAAASEAYRKYKCKEKNDNLSYGMVEMVNTTVD